MPRAKRSSSGFSLIELLVSISIIAVLIGLLLPALPAAWDSARRTACSANLRSIGQVMELYKGGNREAFPVARYMPFPWLSGYDEQGWVSLPEAMVDYIEVDSEAWVCPGDRVVARYEYEVDGELRECGASYNYVTALAGTPYEQTFFARFLRLSPSDTPVGYDFDGGTFETEPRFGSEQVTVDFFHRTRNVLFVDGSVGKYETSGRTDDSGGRWPDAEGDR
jgi:prepilin-type N-terminal cleavage/methylation domain-containing protein/prepilin-type processing-associated H-X9-DG protein